jgi:hypothetical protein
MRIIARQRLSASALALAVGLAVHGVASAQGNAPQADPGMLTGEVARCVNGAEQPAAQVSIGIDGGGASLVRTDSNGVFILALPPGQYTVIATASDGTATRQYVPVETGEALDIGTLDIGGGVAGCGPDSDITAPVLPTLVATPVPTVQPTPAPLAATAIPTALPIPSPTPAPDAPADPASGG